MDPTEQQTHSSSRPSGFFVLRTPLLPFTEFLQWSEGLEAPRVLHDPAELDAALARDRTLLQARLASICSRPEIREALHLASPGMEANLGAWTVCPDDKRGRRTEQSLIRYFSRMTGRATPFGLFAGWTVGELGDSTRLELKGRSHYQRHTRLDTGLVHSLARALTESPEVRKELAHHTNPSLYRVADQYRYVETAIRGAARVTTYKSRSPSLS